MALKIRLARGGAKKNPFYKVVVADSRCPRDGKFIEKVGTYNPFLSNSDEKRVTLNLERIKYWMSVGAKASERIELFLAKVGVCKKPKTPVRPQKSTPKQKAQERIKLENAKKEAAAQA